MSHDTEKYLNHPKFKQLVEARHRFSRLLSLIIILGYGVYVLGMSFASGLMAETLREGGSITYGLLIAVLVIFSGMISSGLYIWWANKTFDTLKQELLDDLGHE